MACTRPTLWSVQSQVVMVLATIYLLTSRTECSQPYDYKHREKVMLPDINVLTLYHGAMTTARRSSPIPQVKCIGGTAGCNSFVPQVVQCYNRGSDGFDVQWECKTDMDNAYRFGRVEVSCEGFDYPDDPYVLRGSCGLEYTLDLTKEGYQQKTHQGHHDYYGDQSGSSQHSSYQSTPYKKGNSWTGYITLVIIGVAIYYIYSTCLTPRASAEESDNHSNNQRDRGQNQPPPPGFRNEYMPGGGCSSSYDDYSSDNTRHRRGTNTGGGFWSGATMGGLLGYLFGSRNTGYQQPYRTRGGWGTGSGWGTGGGWGTGSGWGSGGGWGSTTRSSSGSSGGFSTGTRTASGFGGTKRR